MSAAVRAEAEDFSAVGLLASEDRVHLRQAIPFAIFHVGAVVGVILYHPTPGDIALCLGSYAVRMFAVTGVLHRYFSHRTYSTSRAFQFALALLAMTTVQQGPLWWASMHRHHHRTSDQPEDFHSPFQRGFWFAHVGWVFSPRAQRMDWDGIKDFSCFPELRFLNRYFMPVQGGFAAVLIAIGGMHALVWGLLVSTVLLWQGTYCINSLTHILGRRRFPTRDSSGNSLGLALVTFGEGWHNNHHYYPGSMMQGFYWWQVDVTGYIIRGLAALGLVWGIRKAPPDVLAIGRHRR
jgi:stearoyl-CoA desaturase (delta-9 desaturase)